MDNKDVERKIAVIHAIAGIVLGVLTGIYFGSAKNNPITPINVISLILIGVVLSYPLMLLTKKLYWPEMELKDWLGKGFYIFFVFWLVVWTFLYNI